MEKSNTPVAAAPEPPSTAIDQNQPADNNNGPQKNETKQVKIEEEALDLQGKDRFDHHHFLIKSMAQQGKRPVCLKCMLCVICGAQCTVSTSCYACEQGYCVNCLFYCHYIVFSLRFEAQ